MNIDFTPPSGEQTELCHLLNNNILPYVEGNIKNIFNGKPLVRFGSKEDGYTIEIIISKNDK